MERSCPILTVFLEWLYGHSAFKTRAFLLLLAGFVVKCDPVMPVISWSKTAMKTVGCVCSGPPMYPPLLLKTVWGVIFSSLWAKLNEPTQAELVLLIVPRLRVELIEVVAAVNFSTISFPSDPLQDETVGPRGATGRSYSLWDEEEFLEWLSFAWARYGMTLKSSVEGSVGWPRLRLIIWKYQNTSLKLFPSFLLSWLAAMERFPKHWRYVLNLSKEESKLNLTTEVKWNLLSGRRTESMMDNIRMNVYKENVIIKMPRNVLEGFVKNGCECYRLKL